MVTVVLSLLLSGAEVLSAPSFHGDSAKMCCSCPILLGNKHPKAAVASPSSWLKCLFWSTFPINDYLWCWCGSILLILEQKVDVKKIILKTM